MHTVLVFPPEWRCLHWPYLSLPSLTGYLRCHGQSVTQLDLNLEFIESVTHESALRARHRWAKQLFDELDRRDCLSPVQQKVYADLAWTALASESDWLAQVARTLRILKRPEEFYDLSLCWQALLSVDRLWSLVRLPMMNLDETDLAVATRMEESSAEVLAVVDDGDRNPFLPFLRDVALPRILDAKPGLVGISLTGLAQLFAAATLGRLIHVAAPGIHVTLGGNACSFVRNDLVRNRALLACFDSLIVGEGEAALLALVQALDRKQGLAGVPSLTYCAGGEVHSTAPAPLVDMDSLPPPDYDGLPLDRYLLPNKVLSIISSRDCYWKRCAFCAQRQNGHAKYRRRRVELVVQDLQTLVRKYDTAFFIFCDETVPPRTLAELGKSIPAAGLEIYWDGAARLEKGLTEQVCRDISAAGCTCLQFGLESANDRVLGVIDKGLTRDLATQVLKNTAAAGILNRVSVIIGCPTESASEAQETIDYVLGNDAIIHGVVSQPFAFQRFTRIEANPEQYGLSPHPHPRQDLTFVYDDFDKLSGMSRQEADALNLQLWQELYKRFPKFAASQYPEMVLYPAPFKQPHRRYGSDPPPPRVLVPIGATTMPDGALTGDDPKTFRPRLRDGILLARLRFDLEVIQKTLRTGQWRPMKSVGVQPSCVALNGRLERVIKVSPRVMQVLEQADGTHSLSTIALEAGRAWAMSKSQALDLCRGILKLHKSLLQVGED